MDPDAPRNQMTADEIRRLEDANENPLTGTQWPAGHIEMLNSRRQLPVRGRCQDILDTYHENKVFVLSSGTGSGKSTQIPQFLVFDEFSSKLKIACTQPRVIAAKSVAARVAQEMGVTLGQEVGYQVGGEAKVTRSKTRLVYMTEGVLLNQISSDGLLSEYACVIIDEAHERTIEADMLLALLKRTLAVRDDFKVIVMSATVDSGLFRNYFDNCPHVEVEGRAFDVEVLYIPEEHVSADVEILAADVSVEIHREQKPGHILIFLPGEAEIKKVCNLMKKVAGGPDVFPLYGQLSADQQSLALGSGSTSGRRKCIVATNVAETSLTIEGIVYVIDTGLAKHASYNPRQGVNMLDTTLISKASANQRKERAGRTQNGVCFRLYSEQTYRLMPDSTVPAIKHSQLHHAYLKLLACGHSNVGEFNWIDHPEPDMLMRTYCDLDQWGFLNEDGSASESGKLAAQCTLDPSWFHAILVGDKFGCAQDMVDIAVVCSARKSIFLRPEGFRDLSNQILGKDAAVPSDHIRMANAFNAWMRMRELSRKEGSNFSLEDWSKRHFFDSDALEKVRKTRSQLGPFLQKTAKISPSRASPLESDKVRQALAVAFGTNAAFNDGVIGHNFKVALAGPGRMTAALEPLSCLVSDPGNVSSSYEWVVFTSLDRRGAKTLMRIATVIKPEWLVDLPAFQDENLPRNFKGEILRPELKVALDKIRNKAAASEST